MAERLSETRGVDDEALGPLAVISNSIKRPTKPRAKAALAGVNVDYRNLNSTSDTPDSKEYLPVLPHLDVSDRDLLICVMSVGGRRYVAGEAVDRLLAEFGNFAAVVAASPSDLAYFGGLAHAEILALKSAQIAALRIVRTKIENRPVLGALEHLHAYLMAQLAAQPKEEVRILFLDGANHLIADEAIAHGTVNWAAIKARQVLERALRWRATTIILSHNHPSGRPTPSGIDILTTKWVTDALCFIDVAVWDHLIVSSSGIFSLREAGLLPKPESKRTNLDFPR